MRTIYPVLLVLAIGAAAMMWGMSGIGAVYSQGPQSDLGSADSVNKTANESAVNDDGFGGSTKNSDDGDIIGLILSGGGAIVDVAKLVVLLPLELHTLGAPLWFAIPIGGTAQIIAGVGFVQFITNRYYQ